MGPCWGRVGVHMGPCWGRVVLGVHMGPWVLAEGGGSHGSLLREGGGSHGSAGRRVGVHMGPAGGGWGFPWSLLGEGGGFTWVPAGEGGGRQTQVLRRVLSSRACTGSKARPRRESNTPSLNVWATPRVTPSSSTPSTRPQKRRIHTLHHQQGAEQSTKPGFSRAYKQVCAPFSGP